MKRLRRGNTTAWLQFPPWISFWVLFLSLFCLFVCSFLRRGSCIFKIGSHSVASIVLELTVQSRMTLNSQKSACLCLTVLGFKTHTATPDGSVSYTWRIPEMSLGCRENESLGVMEFGDLMPVQELQSLQNVSSFLRNVVTMNINIFQESSVCLCFTLFRVVLIIRSGDSF